MFACISWIIAFPTLVIVDKYLETKFFPAVFTVDDGQFSSMFIAGFFIMFILDWLSKTTGAATTTVVRADDDYRCARDDDDDDRKESEITQAAHRVIATYDTWIGNIPELASTRHAFERAIARLRSELE